ncbi:heparinase II/III family protein [Bacteroidota bacterium]
MRSILTVVLSISLLFFQLSISGQGRDLLTNSISKEILGSELQGKSVFAPLPKTGDPAWAGIDQKYRDEIINRGEHYLNYEWPSLPAIRYMDYDINGNRTRYEGLCFERRKVLSYLAMAEIFENEGRFLEDLINGLWLTLEETTWVIPAHSGGHKLHDINDVYVDLFSAETAALLAWVDYFLGAKLDDITPLLRKRIYTEVDRRVITSMLEHNDFWYMGFTGRIPNNWNPWIVSNWLTAVLILEDDRERRLESVWKSLQILDNFLNPYPTDGGCDEGPGYWGHAGASLFDCLHLLHSATGGKIDLYDDELVRGIGQYIYKVHIADNWYTNFADGSARLSSYPGTVYRIAKAIDDDVMKAFASSRFLASDPKSITEGRTSFGLRIMPYFLVAQELRNSQLEYEPPLLSVFPDLEVVIARENNNDEGFFTAIKGGYNNESHNHNDAGSFIVYYDGLPLLIDAGVGSYTAKTFSSKRYSIWTMQSAYHNLPSLNGMMQQDGNEYRAKSFQSIEKGKQTITSMNLEDAYPAAAYTESWVRTLTLDRGMKEVKLNDRWVQERQEKRNLWHFMTAYEPKELSEGIIELSNGETPLYLHYDSNFFPKIEQIKIDDSRLERVWGGTIWRITLTIGLKGLNGSQSFIINTSEK